jgi:metal-responsive CopG/Arc/MetJ family transcriptional regulator
MPTQKPIIPVAMDEALLNRIDDYRRTIEGSIPSRSEAIRRLLEEALAKYEKKSKK